MKSESADLTVAFGMSTPTLREFLSIRWEPTAFLGSSTSQVEPELADYSLYSAQKLNQET